MKVCHIVSGDLWAGPESQLAALLTSIKNYTVKVVVLNKGRLYNELQEAGIDVTLIDENELSFFKILEALHNLLKKDPPDILHSHRYKENLLATLVSFFGYHYYLVQTVHGTTEIHSGIKSLKLKLYLGVNYAATYLCFNHVVTVSNEIKRFYRKFLPEKRVSAIHNAVDPKKIVPKKNPLTVREELGVKNSTHLFTAVGRLVPVKDFPFLLESMFKIFEQAPDSALLVVGDGPEKESLQNLAQSLGIENRVHFLGFRNDVLDIVNSTNTVVISSLHEGIPLALLEAMSLGKPVVSTSVGGIPEVIEDRISGLLVLDRSPEAFAKKALKLFNDPKLANRLGDNAQKRIQDRFSLESQKQKFLNLYRSL